MVQINMRRWRFLRIGILCLLVGSLFAVVFQSVAAQHTDQEKAKSAETPPPSLPLPPPNTFRAPTASFSYPISGGETVPDNACGSNNLDKVVNITDDFTITDVNVGVNVTHSSRRHIVISLIGPDGTTVVLHDGTLVGPYSDIDALFDQSAATEGSSSTTANNTSAPNYDTQWNPNGTLDSFNGKESLGNWTLRICDKQNTNAGTFNNAELFFEGTSNAPIPTTIRGTVYDDVNHDGENENESGVANVTVTAYDASGNAAGGGAVTTDSSGIFTITGLTDTTTYRLEFTTLPANYETGPNGTESDSSVLFVTSPASKIQYGIYIPSANPVCNASTANYAVTCFANGDPYDASNLAEPAIARFAYSDRGQGSPTSKDMDTNINDVGSIWGLAYDPATNHLYMSTMLKRHAGLMQDVGGNPLIGALYLQTDPTDSSTVSLFHDFGADAGNDIPNNATRFPDEGGLVGPANTDRSLDATVYPMIGKRGFGDIDISADGSTLYVVNLFDRELYTVNTTGTPTHTVVAGAPWISNAFCNDNAGGGESGVARPWAVKYHNSNIYVGVVCDASTSTSCNATNACSDLTAQIFAYNGTAWSTVLPTAIDLDYERDFQGYSTADEAWHPWTDDYSSISTYVSGSIRKYPQPILADIEFDDDDSIILGFLDRSTHQFGYQNSEPNVVSPNTDVFIFAAGDILRVGYDSTGTTYTLENNGQTYNSSGTLLTGADTTSPTGPGGREFYADNWNGSTTGSSSADSVAGGLALLPGSNEILYAAADRYAFFSAAAVFASNTDGSHQGGVTVYQDDSNGSAGTFVKGGGLGDIELICPLNLPTLEIGNRVWCDNGSGTATADSNGIQDPGEAGITGVTVRLTCGAEYAETTTDGNGNYLFTDTVWAASGNTSSETIPESTACTVTIDTSGANGTAITNACSIPAPSPTSADASSGLGDGNDDVRDSDGTGVAGGIITATVNTNGSNTTGTIGQNDHRIDFGFAPLRLGRPARHGRRHGQRQLQHRQRRQRRIPHAGPRSVSRRLR